MIAFTLKLLLILNTCKSTFRHILNNYIKKNPQNIVCVSCSVISNSVPPWIVACKVPLSMGFPRQEYWSGWPFPSPGDLPNPGIKPGSPALAGGFFITEPCGKSPPSNLMLVFVPFVYAIFSVSTIYKMGVQTFVILFMKCACLCVFINMFSTSNPLKS